MAVSGEDFIRSYGGVEPNVELQVQFVREVMRAYDELDDDERASAGAAVALLAHELEVYQ